MQIQFFIPCNPPKSTHQASLRIMKRADGSPFVGKFAKSKGKAAQNDLMSMLRPFVPATAFIGPVSCKIEWMYPYRKTEKKKNIGKDVPCDTRPDADNLSKMLFDSMTRLGFWGDDSQVADLRFKKSWHHSPGIGVEIKELKETI